MSAMPRPSDVHAYVYCIAQAEPFGNGREPLGARASGVAGRAPRVIVLRDLAAVVSDADATRYDISRENLLAHQIVVEEAMAHSPVLPVRYGTVARSDEDVRVKLLARKFDEFQRLMRYVRDRVELGVRVFWNRERLFAEIADADESVRRLRDAVTGRPPEEMHYQRIDLGRVVERAILRKRDEETRALLDVLRPLADETRVSDALTDTMVMNAAFFVNKVREAEFDAAVDALQDAHAGRLLIKYVGPVPPYNFVNIVVYWDEG